jgi:hypothetical protein
MRYFRTQQSLSKTTWRKRFPRLQRRQTEIFQYGLELADYGFRRSAGSVGGIEASTWSSLIEHLDHTGRMTFARRNRLTMLGGFRVRDCGPWTKM